MRRERKPDFQGLEGQGKRKWGGGGGGEGARPRVGRLLEGGMWGKSGGVGKRGGHRRQAVGWGLGWVGRGAPPLSRARLWYLNGQKATKGNGRERRAARRGLRHWVVGWLGGRARDKGERRTKVSEWRNRPLLTSGCRSLECLGQSLLNGGRSTLGQSRL